MLLAIFEFATLWAHGSFFAESGAIFTCDSAGTSIPESRICSGCNAISDSLARWVPMEALATEGRFKLADTRHTSWKKSYYIKVVQKE